ncbi:MAG: sulfurtransferase [Pseudomonadota bacterium]
MSYETLIDSTELRNQYDPDRWVVLDCRFTLGAPEAGREAFREAHIAGAQYLDLERDVSGPVSADSGRHPLPDQDQFCELLGTLGINPTKQVIVYDDCGGAMAARAWFALRWVGHSDVALLDGGVQSWVKAGFDLTTATVRPQTNNAYPAGPRRDWVVSTEEVAAWVETGQFPAPLIDARTTERFEGLHEPIDRRAGHVPHALNRPLSENLRSDGRFKPAQALEQELRPLVGDQSVVVMCGSGVTACHHLIALKVAGLRDGRLYAGSWSEWIQDSTRPIVAAPAGGHCGD